MKLTFAILALLMAVSVRAAGPTKVTALLVSSNATDTAGSVPANDVVFNGGVTIGGVRLTAWPASAITNNYFAVGPGMSISNVGNNLFIVLTTNGWTIGGGGSGGLSNATLMTLSYGDGSVVASNVNLSAIVGLGTAATNNYADFWSPGNLTNNVQLGNGAGYLTTETDPIVGAVNGIVKSDGAGHITAATKYVDYLTLDYWAYPLLQNPNYATSGIMKWGYGDADAAVPATDGTDYWSPESLNDNWQLGNGAGYLTTETDPIVGAVNGIVKADGAGNIAAATDGSDYWSPASLVVGSMAYTDAVAFVSLLNTLYAPIGSTGMTTGQVQGIVGSTGSNLFLWGGQSYTIITNAPWLTNIIGLTNTLASQSYVGSAVLSLSNTITQLGYVFAGITNSLQLASQANTNNDALGAANAVSNTLALSLNGKAGTGTVVGAVLNGITNSVTLLSGGYLNLGTTLPGFTVKTNGVSIGNDQNITTLNLISGTGVTVSGTNQGAQANVVLAINPSVTVTSGGIIFNGTPLATGNNSVAVGLTANGAYTNLLTTNGLAGATITVSNIPQVVGYSHLRIQLEGGNTNANNNYQYGWLQPNGAVNTSIFYAENRVGNTAIQNQFSTNQFRCMALIGTNSTIYANSHSEVFIYNYQSTNKWKGLAAKFTGTVLPSSAYVFYDNAGVSTNLQAITSFTILPDAGYYPTNVSITVDAIR